MTSQEDKDPEQQDIEIEYVSKSQMKRDMHALQALGEKLVELNDEHLQEMNLPDNLFNAIQEVKRIHQRGARRRQLQYVGKLMRKVDAEEIQQRYDDITLQSNKAVNLLHKIEEWRNRLLEEGDHGLEAFLQNYPQADRQQIRQLVRAAKTEHHQNKPKKSYRNLYQLLKTYIS